MTTPLVVRTSSPGLAYEAPAPRPGRGTDGIAGWIVRRRWWVIASWACLLAVLAPAAARVEQVLDVSARVDGSESAAVDALLRDRFDSPFARYAVLVLSGAPSPSTPLGEAVLRATIDEVRRVHGVTGTVSWLDAHDSLFVAPGHDGTFVLVGVDPGSAAPDVMIEPLRAATAALGERRGEPGLTFRWTGDIPLNYDIRRTSAREGQRAESRALPLTLAMLLIAFGTVVAAFLPVAIGVACIVAALGAAALLATQWPLSILLANLVSMIGLGLGIDYALLMVSRFREELAAGWTPHAAAAHAARAAGHTILLSGAAVLIGFLALALVPLNELRSVAVGGALVVLFSMLVAVTLLPSLLAVLGSRVNRGRLFRSQTGGAPSERWRGWGRWVAAHPLLVLLVAAAPMLVLAAQVRRISTGLPRSGWLPNSMESARALADLQTMDRAGVVQALRIVVELPEGTSALEGDGWRAVARLGHALAADPRVERVQSLPLLTGANEPGLMLTALLPSEVVRSFVSRDQRLAVVEVLPRSTADFPSLTAFVREIRRTDVQSITGVRGVRLHVGGMPAFNADYEDAITGALPLVVALVLGGTFVALLVGFRSVLIPIKALALNTLSVAAALGAVVLVFQDGHGVRMAGLSAGMGSLFPALPVLVFCIVFGLSMDYEVFLVARVAEARRAGADEGESIAEGLARTGGVVTSAAAIMIVVFAAFMLGGFLMTKVLGFALAAAVLFDATAVRMAIGPALLRLAGRWNWWPGAGGSGSGKAADRAGAVTGFVEPS
jgi:putative drug exporter of the RND superfamily